MRLAPVALFTALLPIIGGNLAYWLAVSHDHVPWCLVYLEGCTTVSSTGRHPPESLLFRATLIPGAVLMIIYWRLAAQWLRELEASTYRGAMIIQILGMAAGVFLIIYTVALGFIDPQYHVQRRIGVTGFFGCTYLAQLLLARRLLYISRQQPHRVPPLVAKLKIGLCLGLMIVGLLSIPVSTLFAGNTVENIIEWNFSLLMYVYFLLTYWMWRKSGFQARFEFKN